jgi:hypothetical protein
MQLVLDAAVAFVGEGLHPARRQAALLGKLLLQVLPLLVVALVDRLEHTTVNQQRHKARLV